jgi:hypothetical protein
MILRDGGNDGRREDVFCGSPEGGFDKRRRLGVSRLDVLVDLAAVEAGVEELGLDAGSACVAPAETALVAAALQEQVAYTLQV